MSMLPEISYNRTTNYPGMVPGTSRKYTNSSGVEEEYVWAHLQSTSGTVAAGGTLCELPGLAGEVTDDVANSYVNFARCVTQASTVADSYFWGIVYKHGVTLLTNADNDAVAGDTLVVDSTHVLNCVAAGTPPTDKMVAIATASEAAGAVVGIVDLRGGY
jgi:hypothetical protein